MLPQWSQKSKKAVSLFFRKWNDIDVYVEDTSFSTLKIYNNIFSRLSGDKFCVQRVFPLGGKRKVIDACIKHSSACGREALYIVDGDLDLLCDDEIEQIERLYIQPRYCIENFLVDRDSMAELLYEEISNSSREDCANYVMFDEFLMQSEMLLELFIVFAVMRKFFPALETVGLGLSKFIDGGKHPKISVDKISEYVGTMHQYMCKAYGIDRVVKEELLILDRSLRNDALLIFVSGKDFLLPAFMLHVRSWHKIHGSKDSIKLRLVKYCNLNPFEELKSAMCERSNIALTRLSGFGLDLADGKKRSR